MRKQENKNNIYAACSEAKLVVGDMVLSIGTEFIENESEDVKKQDCELKAFYRLAEKIKQDISLTSYLNSGRQYICSRACF